MPNQGTAKNGQQTCTTQYQRHRPEKTLLYQLVSTHYPIFQQQIAEQGRPLPGYVQREFEDYLECGRLEYGFLRLRCEDCHKERLLAFSCKHRGFCPSCGARRMAESSALLVDEVFPRKPIRQWVLSFPFQLRFLFASDPVAMSRVLGIVNRVITLHLIKKAGYSKKTARTGAVTLIQRFGSALNLNIHFHMLFLDGVYTGNLKGPLHFHRVRTPTSQEITELAQTIAQRVGRHLERQGLLERDAENCYLNEDEVPDSPMNQLFGASVTYRIAVGPQAGRKVFTLQTLPDCEVNDQFEPVGKVSGFSLHAGVNVGSNDRSKLERLCRYVSRPAVAEKRLTLTQGGQVRYRLKTPYRDGTTHVIFEPLDFIARLAALIPRPRANLTRFYGVFAPNSKYRALVTASKRGKKTKHTISQSSPNQHTAMSWAQRLKRVFNLDMTTCDACGGRVKVIASIEDPEVIKDILSHIKKKEQTHQANPQPQSRAPPQLTLFD